MVSSRNTRCGSFTLKSFIVLSLVHVEGGQQTNVNHDYMRIEALLEYMVVEDNGAGEQADVLGPEDAEMFENIANCMVQADILSGNPRWLENFKEIKKVAIDLLYNNCRKHWTLLHFNLHLLMLMSRHGWSDTSFSDLLHMLVDAELCKDAELGEAPYYSPPHPPPPPRTRMVLPAPHTLLPRPKLFPWPRAYACASAVALLGAQHGEIAVHAGAKPGNMVTIISGVPTTIRLIFFYDVKACKTVYYGYKSFLAKSLLSADNVDYT